MPSKVSVGSVRGKSILPIILTVPGGRSHFSRARSTIPAEAGMKSPFSSAS